jgi:hypothetical protein
MGDDMHKLPIWNRVTTLRDVTAAGKRPSLIRAFSREAFQF